MTEKQHTEVPEGAWFKSSYSLTVPPDAWSAFVGMVRATEQ
ncbi:DUF397 domain-containing protein [Streptomyces sp. NPDC050585]